MRQDLGDEWRLERRVPGCGELNGGALQVFVVRVVEHWISRGRSLLWRGEKGCNRRKDAGARIRVER